MTCVKCDHDLEDCECPDMPERFEAIKDVVVFGRDYLIRLEKQANRIKGQRDLDNIGKRKL